MIRAATNTNDMKSRSHPMRIADTVIALSVASALISAAPASTVTGTWNMGLQGDHVIPIALVLKQDGTSVSGSLAMPTQHVGERVDVPLSGAFEDAVLKVSGTVERASEPTTIEIEATLNDDGALEGQLTMRGRALRFTAERLKERK